MNTHEQEVEAALRRAPKPAVPPGLRDRLQAGGELSARRDMTATRSPLIWLRRWWTALAPAAISAACAAVLFVQHQDIEQLKQTNAALADQAAERVTERAQDPTPQPSSRADPSVDFNAEIERLKQRADELRTAVTELERMRVENDALRVELAAPSTNLPPELQAIAEAREKAWRVECVNHLKQLGIAVRQWAMDHNLAFPPDILSMSNELNTPKILVCPADTSRQPASDWNSFTSGNCSYEYLTPSAVQPDPSSEPTRVLSRCPIHGTIGLCDGSARMWAAEHPDWFIQRDGKLYYEPK